MLLHIVNYIKILRYSCQKMNSLKDILYFFMSKCVNFVNSYLKEYLTKRSFIIMF